MKSENFVVHFLSQFGKPTWDMFVITQMFLAFVFNKNKNVKKI